MMKRALWSRLLLCTLVGMSGATGAAVISVGAFPELSPSPSISIPADTFLVPVQVSGALGLQDWQFDLVFDNTVVEVVDPLDGSSGIYGAEFTPGDADSLSFILGGFPFNFLGLVDDVAGSYPALLTGASGDGVLAYVLFQYLVGQENNDPGFGIEEVTVQQAPEPGTPALLAAALLILSFARHASTRRRTIAGVR